MKKIVKTIGSAIVNGTINATAAVAAGVAGGYVINHDMFNDSDISTVAGVGIGVGTGIITRHALMGAKSGICKAAGWVSNKTHESREGKSKVSRRAKKEVIDESVDGTDEVLARPTENPAE